MFCSLRIDWRIAPLHHHNFKSFVLSFLKNLIIFRTCYYIHFSSKKQTMMSLLIISGCWNPFFLYGSLVKWFKTPPFHGGNGSSILLRATKETVIHILTLQFNIASAYNRLLFLKGAYFFWVHRNTHMRPKPECQLLSTIVGTQSFIYGSVI